MNKPERELAKACEKIAKWYRDQVSFTKLENGFILKFNSDSEFTPTIGVIGDNLVGSQDDVDVFLDLIGYEAQVERILFDASRARFIADAGWSGKYWRKPGKENVTTTGSDERVDLIVDAIVVRMPRKISAIMICLIAAVKAEGRRRIVDRVKHPFK